jgi:glycosyltransferase involved in cell wall biosynthesis
MAADVERHRGGRVVMIGPLPPPNGGVANFVRNMMERLPSEGFEVTVHRTGGFGASNAVVQPIRDLTAALRFVLRSRGDRADITHVHTSSYYSFLRNIPYVLWARHGLGSKVALHIHGGMFVEFYDRASPLVRSMVRMALGRSGTVIVTSPSWIGPITRIAGEGPEVISLPNGFDSKVFRPMDKGDAREELGMPRGSKVLVTVGYLEPVKGHAHLMEAMVKVASHHEDILLYILGDGSLRRQLQDRIGQLGLEKVVRLVTEPFPSSGIARWMSAADVFVLPSLGEGNPTVMFECLGCGRPFVGTEVGGVPDVICSDRLGLLCPPGDAEALAAAIDEALEREWDAAEIAAHALRYSWDRLASDLASAYDRMIERA